MAISKNSFTILLSPEQQVAVAMILEGGNYQMRQVPHTIVAATGEDVQISVYQSGKCLIQGKGAEDWIRFVLEPQVLMEARLGYEEVLDPAATSPHMGVDESGKGDFFGPMVIASVYVDEKLAKGLKELNVRDSKTITSDKVSLDLAKKIREFLKDKFAVVSIGPSAYNRLYDKMKTVNKILAWGHARAIENLMEKVPNCPRALSDQFGPTHQIERALLAKGRTIKLEQRPKAESDVAVAAASILARAGFLEGLRKLGETHGVTLPKGASEKVKSVAGELVHQKGGGVLMEVAKCHFQTTDKVLTACGLSRKDAGIAPAPERKPFVYHRKSTSSNGEDS